MKTILKFAVLTIFALFITACNDDDQVTAPEPDSKSETEFAMRNNGNGNGGSVINQEYPQAQAEVLETFGAIAKSIIAGAGQGYNSEYMDQLISFHAYGDKFTEFNGGQSFDSAGNEQNERQLFGVDLEEWDPEVNKFAAKEGTLKVAVYYGNVANLTFTSDFHLTHKEYGQIIVENLITLLFVKTNGEWKMVHEHHSQVN